MRALYLFALACLCWGSAQAGVIYTENFESYAAGSSLAGQGGWTGDGGQVGVSAQLDGNSSNHAPSGSTTVLTQDLGASFVTGGLYSMSFDGYASTSSVQDSNSVIGFTDSSLGTSGVARLSWSAFGSVHGGPRWVFDARALTGNGADFVSINGGYDQRLSFEIFIDTVAMEVYGRYDFGAGSTDTAHYAISAAQLSTLDGISIFHDNRSPGSYSPADFDNISVSFDAGVSVPAPGLMVLMLIGLTGLGLTRRSN